MATGTGRYVARHGNHSSRDLVPTGVGMRLLNMPDAATVVGWVSAGSTVLAAIGTTGALVFAAKAA
jgi:hypothetical protein